MSYTELTTSQKAMYDESSVARVSTGVSMHIATVAQLQAKYPHLTFNDDDWRPVSRALREFALGRLPAPMVVGIETGVVIPFPTPNKPSRARPPTRAGASYEGADRASRARGPASTSPEVEARVRELSGERLVQVAAANAVVVAIHPTNPGITAMRRKNALLALFRHGASIANV